MIYSNRNGCQKNKSHLTNYKNIYFTFTKAPNKKRSLVPVKHQRS